MKRLSCLFLWLVIAAAREKMRLLHEWRSLDFEYPSPSARDAAIRSKSFIPGNPIPIDVDVYQSPTRQEMFLTMPRFKDGVPASLVTVSKNSRSNTSPLLKPYPPDWSWHKEGQCSGVTSAFRTQIDKCGRLWVIDSGMVDLFKFPRRRLCQPKILAFNLVNDQVVGKHQFPSNILTEGSVLATIAVDVRDDQCSDAFAYVADVTGFAILVFDSRRGKSWRVQSNTMFPYPPHAIFRTNGIEFDLMDGVLGLALAPNNQGDRKLYYHPFASVRESWVPTSVLRNESLYTTGFNAAPRRFQTSEGERPSQAASEAFDKNGNLYFGLIAENSINCWNSDKTYDSSSLQEIARDDNLLQFTTGIKVIETPNGDEELYVLTDRFQLAMVGQMDPTQLNFRVLSGRLSELTKGTNCAKGRHQGGSHRPNKPSPVTFPVYKPKPYGR